MSLSNTEQKMKAADLRIGNLVVKKIENKPDIISEVESITYSNAWYVRIEGVTTPLENCVGIELTEEWLLKAGFHKDNYGLYVKVFNNEPYTSGCKIEYWAMQYEKAGDLVWDISVGESLDKVVHISDINYLHLLQNIHHALTGTELTFKD